MVRHYLTVTATTLRFVPHSGSYRGIYIVIFNVISEGL